MSRNIFDDVKKNRIWLFTLLLTITISAIVYLYFPKPEIRETRIVDFEAAFYNVENLFDTIDHADTWDEEYTPDSKKAYDSERYMEKLSRIAEVLNHPALKTPEIIGLCEVENPLVVEALRTRLDSAGKYMLICEEGDDFRGIDNALLIDTTYFEFDWYQSITVNLDSLTTRDILCAAMHGPDKRPILIMVNHWPSRWGGKKKSDPKRARAAETLRDAILQFSQDDPNRRFIVMGDFNDFPTDSSIAEVLNVPGLINLSKPLHESGQGSHNYRGEWGMLDQMMVKHGETYPLGVDTHFVFKWNKLLYYSERYEDSLPSRSFGGNNYYGGYSDHLPIVTYFKISSTASGK